MPENQRARYRGRSYEYRVAKKIDGKVVGRSKAIIVKDKAIPIDPNHPPDVVSDWISVECKYYSEIPVWLKDVMLQSVTNCPEGLIPIAWIGDRTNHNHYVIIREQDWLDLHH